MCGCAFSNSKINGTMKKQAIMGNLNTALIGTVGFIAAKQLDRISFVAQNPLVGALAKTGIGLVLASGKNKMAQPFGMGMAVAGLTGFASNLLANAGISGMLPYNSVNVASVAGPGNGMPIIRVN